MPGRQEIPGQAWAFTCYQNGMPEVFRVNERVVAARNSFQSPYKVSETLINEARILHVVQGQSIIYSANHQIKVQAGDTFIMKADSFISNWQENESGKDNQILGFALTSEYLRSIYGNQVPNGFSQTATEEVFPIQKARRHAALDNYFAALNALMDSSNFLNKEMIGLKVKEMLLLLSLNDHKGQIRQLLGDLFGAREYNFREVIQTHLFEDLNQEDLAFLAGLSLSSFKRKFSSVYGTSPNKYITKKRLEKARALLQTTELRISEIAYDCGFSDVGYFSKTFKNHYKMLPSELRNRH